MRPISLVNPNKTPILRSLLEALGINGQLIAENMVEFSSTCELVLSTIKKLGKLESFSTKKGYDFTSSIRYEATRLHHRQYEENQKRSGRKRCRYFARTF